MCTVAKISNSCKSLHPSLLMSEPFQSNPYHHYHPPPLTPHHSMQGQCGVRGCKKTGWTHNLFGCSRLLQYPDPCQRDAPAWSMPSTAYSSQVDNHFTLFCNMFFYSVTIEVFVRDLFQGYFVRDILSGTFCQGYFVREILPGMFFSGTFCQIHFVRDLF